MDKRMIRTEAGKKSYYINSISYPKNIDEKIERGDILIDDNKIWSIHPLKLDDSDYTFIVEKLPDWFASMPDLSIEAKNQLSTINVNDLKNKLKYVFTHFLYDEDDVYLLKLKYGDTTYRIYISKRHFNYNSQTHDFDKDQLLYPFQDEDWNRNFYETKEIYLKMRDKEEDGYEKYFSNK